MIQGVAAKWSFSSLSANKGVNQQVMRFTPFITPQKVSRYFLYGLLRHDVRDSILTLAGRSGSSRQPNASQRAAPAHQSRASLASNA